MTESEAIDRAIEILNSKITNDLINEFYSLEQYIEDFKFGDLVEALIAITPRNLLENV
jgi:hypothetical protein